jgi:hypothetical protein
VCGSIHLNTAFEDHIKFLVGPEYESPKITPLAKRNMMNVFEGSLKPDFSLADEEPYYYVDLKGVKDSEEHGIRDNTIPIRKSVTSFNEIARKHA